MGVTFLQGVLTPVASNLINPYTGETLFVTGNYYVNNTPVTGSAPTNNTLLSSVDDQFFSLEDSMGNLLIDNFQTILMSNGNDILNLASTIHILGDMLIEMGNGNDIVWANAGNDTINGGDGNDILHGGPGNDTISGNADDDVLIGASGDDTLDGGTGIDVAVYHGNYAYYTLTINTGSITVQDNIGNDGTDTVFNNVETLDFVDGTYQNGTFTPRDLTFIATAAAETFLGGAGHDTVDYTNSTLAVNVNLSAGTGYSGFAQGDTYTSIERIIGSSFNDVLTGDSRDNTLEGGDGNDEIYGNKGSDLVQGEAGNDRLFGGHQEDTLFGGDGDDVIYGHLMPKYKDYYYGTPIFTAYRYKDDNASDTLYGEDGNDYLFGNGGHDFLYGGNDNDRLYGENGNDTLEGNDGTDWLFGGNGDDILNGGSGVDTLYGGAGADTYVFASGETFGWVDNVLYFRFTQNDALDISDLLIGYDPLNNLITDFVQITDNGTTSYLAVDADGGADNFVQIATLTYSTGLTDEAALEASGHLITI